jgi:beta-ureidopropionase / N-carbamoyl-L-amino-acid hydrolase
LNENCLIFHAENSRFDSDPNDYGGGSVTANGENEMTQVMSNVLADMRIDGDRLLARIAAMAEIGKTKNGGCNRQAMTDDDRQGRDLFVEWARAAGCEIRIDPIGNIFARYPGTDINAAPIVSGSHLDTQPTGGKFDGVYGVLAALEVVSTLSDQRVHLRHAIDVVVWTNEEGARFSPGCVGSSVATGAMELKDAYAITDAAGLTLGEELERIGYKGKGQVVLGPVTAAFETHIEQGPILEARRTQIGVVEGVIGLIWYDLVLHGVEAHAGPTPMEDRTDPWSAALPILEKTYALAVEYAPGGRCTIGTINASPGSRNTVPGRLTISVDLRHTNQTILNEIDRRFRLLVAETCAIKKITYDVSVVWDMPVTEFDRKCISAVTDAVSRLGYDYMPMFSGAGHDSAYLARKFPTSMIFVPCENGISHNEAENAKAEDIIAGANVLLQSCVTCSAAN